MKTMEESAGDIENPPPTASSAAAKKNPHNNTHTPINDPNKKLKLKLLSAFLLVVVVLSVALGVTFQGNTNSNTSSSPSTNDEKREGGKEESSPEELLGQTTPTVDESTYLVSPGPIQARIRMATADIANGYTSCDDLKDDIRNALKHLANSIIAEESRNGWYNETNYCEDPAFIMEDTFYVDDAAFEPAMDRSAASKVKEDNIETNNQVQGVDEADFVKSDGKHVFTAYGDVIFAYDAQDANKGLSITRMPYNDTADKDCFMVIPEPMPVDDIAVEETTTTEVSPDATSTPGSSGRNRKVMMMTDDMMPIPCYIPKPQVHSLLLHGSRLTAIVSEESYTNYETSTLWDFQDLTIKVYDAENVPLDGSPLTLLGEKKIKGDYHNARSIDNYAAVITTSQFNTYSFAGALYRYNPQYCGLNSTAYEALAKETALNATESFMEKMVKDLELELDGDGICDGIFQVASMQSGNSNEVYGSNLLANFVHVMNFDMAMSTDELKNDFSTSSSGAFSPGWPESIYLSQGFAGVVTTGSDYNPSTDSWDESTYVLGFNTSVATPKPFAFARTPGRPVNKFATDLYEGHLRIATTKTDWYNTNTEISSTVNQIFVFKVPGEGEGPEMELVGATNPETLGKKNERITAVRFMGDRAYVETFESMGPLYVVDLGTPSEPKVIGELEIPGFSEYLHEVELDGQRYMLGIGYMGIGMEDYALKIGLFDISDEENPIQSAFHLEKQAFSAAGTASLAFRYLPASQLLIIPKSVWTWTEIGNFDGFVVYSVNSTHITPVHEIQHADSQSMYGGCWYNAYLQPRSLVLQSKLTTFLSHSVLSTDLETGDTLWDLNFDKTLNNTEECHDYFVL